MPDKMKAVEADGRCPLSDEELLRLSRGARAAVARRRRRATAALYTLSVVAMLAVSVTTVAGVQRRNPRASLTHMTTVSVAVSGMERILCEQ